MKNENKEETSGLKDRMNDFFIQVKKGKGEKEPREEKRI
jgi:hypothetical protein